MIRRHLRTAVLLVSAATALAAAGAAERAGDPDWPLHNLDLRNQRFSPLDRINTSNVSRLAPAWSLQVAASENIAQQTPLVIGGVMYFNAGARLFAIDAATGKPVWTMEAPLPPVTGGATIGGRGPVYGDGRIYATAGAAIYAVEARTGTLVESFGEKGVLAVVRSALRFKYPGQYAETLDPRTIGYRIAAPPAYFNGTLYVGVAASANLIRGGLLIALDARTGAVQWAFTTIPQAPTDDGWEIAGETWGYGRRFGGGIWTQPAIDADLGLIYVNASNPSPDYDGTPRLGANLFTNSVVALHLATGTLAWYFQTTHHDLWDSDLANGPVLFDRTVGGATVKGVASFGKTCYAYILNRETGRPINPIVETPVSTQTDVPGERPWPTQPIPYASTGAPQQPFCAVYPTVTDPEAATRVRPQFHPFMIGERIIMSPGITGGAIWGSSSFSPRTGLIYVSGKNQSQSLRVKVAGDTLTPGPNFPGYSQTSQDVDSGAMKVSQTLAAYDPITGAQAWRTEMAGAASPGSVVTAGDVVFQPGSAGLFAFDARSGRELLAIPARGISGSPLTFHAGGKQFVAIVAGNTVMTFALP